MSVVSCEMQQMHKNKIRLKNAKVSFEETRFFFGIPPSLYSFKYSTHTQINIFSVPNKLTHTAGMNTIQNSY